VVKAKDDHTDVSQKNEFDVRDWHSNSRLDVKPWFGKHGVYNASTSSELLGLSMRHAIAVPSTFSKNACK